MLQTDAPFDGVRRASPADLDELVARHPLPEGVPDATVNKAQLATALGASDTTLSNWLRRGLPFEEAGTNGREYKFRLSTAFAWVQAMREGEAEARRAGDEAAAQLSLALLGDDALDRDAATLSPGEQKRLLEVELQRLQLAREKGALIKRDEVVGAFEDTFAAIRDALDALPDRLARELGVEGRDLERIEAACDDVLAGAERAVARLVKRDEEN
jgi:phage terminase Nu1 subunit (DNA packaging protein)